MKQRDGKFTRPEGDYFAIKTGMGQIFQGFKTADEAETFGKTLSSGAKGFEVIESPWFYDPIGGIL